VKEITFPKLSCSCPTYLARSFRKPEWKKLKELEEKEIPAIGKFGGI